MNARVDKERLETPQAPDMSMIELYDALAKPFARYLHQLHLAAPDVEDIMQDTFLLVHNAGGYRSGRRSPKGWLFEIGRLLSLKLFRRKRQAEATFAPAEEGGNVKDEVTSPSHLLARGQLVQEIVGELSEKQRACYVLFEAHGFTAQEIGELEGLPVGTVYSCLRLAREHIEEKNELLAARDRSVKVLRQKRKVAS